MSHMRRVTKQHPCRICEHGTWCLEGKTVALCMRVQSERPKNFTGGEIGWIHPLDGSAPRIPYQAPVPRPIINVSNMMREWARNTVPGDISRLSKQLGVSPESLDDLQFVMTDRLDTWGVPMRDGLGNYIGIRIRHESGKKWAVPGSHAGIFVPMVKPKSTMFIVEGPTDCAAAITLGYFAIGRPSCSGGVPYIIKTIERLKIQKVVIVADNDEAGIRGAETLKEFLTVPSCVLLLPCKDLREFISIGDKSTIDQMTEQLVWTQPRQAA